MDAAPDDMVLARYLARAGLGSRRACQELVGAGRVRVNGVVTTDLATRVAPGCDRVECDAVEVYPETFVYLALHKPVGYTCSNDDPHARSLAVDLIQPPPAQRLFSVGRLDRDSEGLLILTNDGDLANHLMHPRYGVRKVYEAWTDGVPTAAACRRLRAGIEDDGERLAAREVRVLAQEGGAGHLEIVIAEGKKREVRRLCAAVGCPVRRLLRTRFGPLALGNLPPGAWRELTTAEVAALKAAGRPGSNTSTDRQARRA